MLLLAECCRELQCTAGHSGMPVERLGLGPPCDMLSLPEGNPGGLERSPAFAFKRACGSILLSQLISVYGKYRRTLQAAASELIACLPGPFVYASGMSIMTLEQQH